MTVTPSTLIAVNATPTAPAQVWQPLALPRADWSQPVTVDTSWRTIVDTAATGAEQRSAAQTRPSLAITYLTTALDADSLSTLRAWQRRRLAARTLIPLWSDRSTLSSAAALGATTLVCDTRYRRFSVGARVGLVPVGAGLAPVAYQLATVATIAEDHLTLAAPGLAAGAAAGTLVVPLIEADVALTTAAGAITTAVGRLTIEAADDPGPWCLDPLCAPAAWDGAEQLVDGLPVLTLSDCWASGMSMDRSRPGTQQPAGLGALTHLAGHPTQQFRTTVRCLSRAAAWQWIHRFHAARGRLLPMIALDPSERYHATALTATSLTVAATGSVHAWSERPLLYLQRADGTAALRTLTAATRSLDGTTDTLQWSESAPLTGWALADLATAATAYRVRFASDSMAETWRTDTVCEISIDLVELHAEATVAIADLAVLATLSADGQKAYPAEGWCYTVVHEPSIWTDATCTFFEEADEIWPMSRIRINNTERGFSSPAVRGDGGGVWYCEMELLQAGAAQDYLGFSRRATPWVTVTPSLGGVTYPMLPQTDDTTAVSLGVYSIGFILGMLLDLDAGTLTWYRSDGDGVIAIKSVAVERDMYFQAGISRGVNSSNTSRWALNTGQRAWAYPTIAALARYPLGVVTIEGLP